MDDQYKKLLEYINSHHLSGLDPESLKPQLLQAGWDSRTVDSAIEQIKSQNSMAPPAGVLGSNQRAPNNTKWIILGAVSLLVAVALIVFFVSNQNSDDSRQPQSAQQQSDVVLSETFTSQQAGFSFNYPEGWEVADLSSGREDSFYWQLDGPENDRVGAELEEKYVGDTDSANGDSLISQGQSDALNDPEAAKIVTVNIKINREPTFTVEDSIEDWKALAETISQQPGFSIDNLTPIKVSGFDGYKYDGGIDLGEGEVKSIEYVVIMPNQRIEVSVFPGQTNYADAVQAIVESIKAE